MAINLTSVVMQFLTPETIAQIASFLGIERAAAQKAAEGAVPAVLAGLTDLIRTPAGASQLSKLVSQQQGSPSDLLRNSGAQGLAETGATMLSGLFGNKTTDTMAQALGKFAGTGDSGGKSLLGVIGPLVISALGHQQREAGLDAKGLVWQLQSQKNQIVSAIPSGLADRLGAAGLIDKVESGLRTAAAGGGQIAGVSERTSADAGRAAYATASKTQWPYWLAALVLLGGLAWYATDRSGQTTVADRPAATRHAAETVGVAPPDLVVDGVNLTKQVNSSIGTLKSVLSTIGDATDAQAALPKIKDATAQLDDITARAAKLSPDARGALAKLIAAATPAVNQMCDKVMASPAGPVVKPAIDSLRSKLDALARA